MTHSTADLTTLADGLPPAIAARAMPTIDRYFAHFNGEDYGAVAALFAPEGQLLAPFESPVQGREAIYNYLKAEATGMRAAPVSAAVLSQGGRLAIAVTGRVQTRHFAIAVRWIFGLGTDGQILSAEIRLLASLQELLPLRRG